MTCATSLIYRIIMMMVNNSTRNNSGITTKITYEHQVGIYVNRFYYISSMNWPYRSCMDPILVDSTKCTHDMHKSYVASSYNTIMREGDWRSSTIVILEGDANRIIRQNNGY